MVFDVVALQLGSLRSHWDWCNSSSDQFWCSRHYDDLIWL